MPDTSERLARVETKLEHMEQLTADAAKDRREQTRVLSNLMREITELTVQVKSLGGLKVRMTETELHDAAKDGKLEGKLIAGRETKATIALLLGVPGFVGGVVALIVFIATGALAGSP